MKQGQQVHIQKSKDALSYYRQIQRLYTASYGDYLGIRECDDTYNDWNHKIVDAYREHYDAAYLGRINYGEDQRQRIADDTRSVFGTYAGQLLYNFCYNFCVSASDRTLEELIRHQNNAAVPLSKKEVNAVMDRIQVLCGQTFIWHQQRRREAMNYIVYGERTGARCYGAINLHEGKVGVDPVCATLIPDCGHARMCADKLAEMVLGFIFQIRGAGTHRVYYRRADRPEESI